MFVFGKILDTSEEALSLAFLNERARPWFMGVVKAIAKETGNLVPWTLVGSDAPGVRLRIRHNGGRVRTSPPSVRWCCAPTGA